MDVSQNMALFRELMHCGDDVSTWCYDADGALLETNCPDREVFATAFTILGCLDRMMAHWKSSSAPVRLGSGLGLVWGAAFEEKDGKPYRAWLIGPFFYTDVSMRSIRDGFNAYIDVEVSMAWKHHFIEALYHVPTMPNVVFNRFLLMLHYCLTGEHLTPGDLKYAATAVLPGQPTPARHRDRHRVWSAEQALLQMVRNGDPDYRKALEVSSMLSNGVPVKSEEPLRQGKVSNIVFCSIVCRAAIEGGLSPEEGYALGDAYIQKSESAKSWDELTAIGLAMYDDFIQRVHKCRTNPALSPAVQKCVDYIELHLTDRIRASDLAEVAGYGEYYITHKFREETGFSVNTYVKFAKIERAKVLLRSTESSVQEIADTLGFATRSHFSQSFKQVAGVSPAEYRAQTDR